jgi:hypothetical protein
MLLLPTALLTCFFCLLICAAIDLVIFLAGYFGLLGWISVRGWPLWVIFGAVWYLSLAIAFRVYGSLWRSQLPPQFRH